MSDLDRELLEAIQSSEEKARGGEATETPAVSLPKSKTKRTSKGGLGLLVVLLGIGGLVLGLVFSSTEDAVIYSVTTDKLLADKAKYEGKNVRVEGDLVSGSLRHRAEPCEYRFSIKKGDAVLPVRYEACVVPDTFKDVPDQTVQVTAEGKLLPEGHLAATNILAKCPSKYEMQERAKKGESAPHAMYPKPEASAPNASAKAE